MIWKTWVKIAGRLSHVYRFGEMAIEKGIFDIKLMQWPPMEDSNCEDNPNSSSLDNWAEGMFKIKSRKLSIALCNPINIWCEIPIWNLQHLHQEDMEPGPTYYLSE